jgi:hypothetical protein
MAWPWRWNAPRTLAQLAAFGRKSWRLTKPVPFYKAPNNWFGRMLGVAFRIPGAAEAAYKVLRDDGKLSDVTILFLALLVPTAVGMMCIFAADLWVVRGARKASAQARHRHALLAAQRQQQAVRAVAETGAAAAGAGSGGGAVAGAGATAPAAPHPQHPHFE